MNTTNGFIGTLEAAHGHPARPVIVHAAVANVDPLVIAQAAEALGLNGFVGPGWGFGDWGVEEGSLIQAPVRPVSILKSTTYDLIALEDFIRGILDQYGEDAAYFARMNGTARLLWRDGHFTPIPNTEAVRS